MVTCADTDSRPRADASRSKSRTRHRRSPTPRLEHCRRQHSGRCRPDKRLSRTYRYGPASPSMSTRTTSPRPMPPYAPPAIPRSRTTAIPSTPKPALRRFPMYPKTQWGTLRLRKPWATVDYGSFFASRLCLRVRHYRTPRDYRSIQSDDVARIAPVIVRFVRWGVFTGVIALE